MTPVHFLDESGTSVALSNLDVVPVVNKVIKKIMSQHADETVLNSVGLRHVHLGSVSVATDSVADWANSEDEEKRTFIELMKAPYTSAGYGKLIFF